MIKVIKHYWTVLRRKDYYNFDHVKPKGRTIYNNVERFHGERMTFVHRRLKMLFVKPVILFCEWLFKGKLTSELSDNYQYVKLKVFDEAFEEALNKWNTLYRPHAYGKYKKPETFTDDHATKMLRFIKQVYKTINANDTAYLEFHNFLMDELNAGMKNVNKNHVLYTDKNINDNRYFYVTDNIKNGNIELRRVK